MDAAQIHTLRVTLLAFCSTSLLIPLFARLSARVGLVDVPNERKIHDRPVPLVGGLAIYCGVVAAVLDGGFLAGQVLALLLATLIVLTLGVLDDRLELHSVHRLMVQIAVSLGLCALGVRFHLVGMVAADWLLTLFWMVGTINAFNCLDCADAMAGTAAFCAFETFAAIAAVNGRYFIAQACVAGAVSVLAFLRYNRPKARVFLGDTGSTFLGLMLASVSILALRRPGPGAHQVPWPVVALAIPVYDVIIVHLRRYLDGLTSIRDLLASTGKDHLPHRLLALGVSPWGTIGVVATLSLLAGAAAWCFSFGQWLTGVVALLMLCAMLWQVERRWVAARARASGAAPAMAVACVKAEAAVLNGNGRNGHHPDALRMNAPGPALELSRAAGHGQTEPLSAAEN